MLGPIKSPNNDPIGGTVVAQSPRLCQVVVPAVWAVVLPGGNVRQWYRQFGWWYHPDKVFQVVVSPSIGSDTARTEETWDETFLGSKFEST